jgi:hypothetical protein
VHPVHGRVGLLADALVEVNIVLVINIVLVSQPQSFIGIDELPVPYLPLDLLFGLFCLFFDLKVITSFFSCILGNYLFFNLFLFVQIYGEINEL